MNINGQNQNISFKSNINIVSFMKYVKLRGNLHPKYIDYSACIDEFIKTDKLLDTDKIRTCTAGAVVGKNGLFPLFGEKTACGFHFLDLKITDKEAEDRVKFLMSQIERPKNVLLIGSKNLKSSLHSIPFFNKIENEFLNIMDNVSIFKTHKLEYNQTHFIYTGIDDTFTVCVNSARPLEDRGIDDVKDIYDLASRFEKIRIANTDKLFIDGKEVSRKIFEPIFNK